MSFYQQAGWALLLLSVTEQFYLLSHGCGLAVVVLCVLVQLLELPLHCFLLCIQDEKGLLLILLDQSLQTAVLLLKQLLCPIAHLLNITGHICE